VMRPRLAAIGRPRPQGVIGMLRFVLHI
jgi:hypothetical protein